MKRTPVLQWCIFKSEITEGSPTCIFVCFFKDLRMEIARQELIAHARETASKVLKAINGELRW